MVNAGSAIDGILLIESLPDDALYSDLTESFPPETNPRWIQARQLATLYDRNLVDDGDYDVLADKIDLMASDRWFDLLNLLTNP